MKIAFVHDWLVTYAGAERVLEQMLITFPEADLFSTVDLIPDNERSFINNKPVQTTFLQKIPFLRTRHRMLLPLMPLAIEQLDMTGYDVVVSSSHAIAKGILTGPNQLHICMCHSPMRYAWDLQHQYLRESGLTTGLRSWVVRWLLHKMRIWDARTASNVDYFIANSSFIRKRILKVYRRESAVIYPPVYTDQFAADGVVRGDFYLTSSRLVPYKRIDLIIQTFSNRFPDKALIVIGDGPDMKKLKAMAGPNITLMGYQPFEVLRQHMSSAKAFIFAAEEDFGIVPLEAQASGTAVIAFGKGGATETIIGLDAANPTGVFFDEQSITSLAAAIEEFEANSEKISPKNCVENAKRFNESRFRTEFKTFVEDSFSKWQEI